ncbi:hypothetical protein MKX29_24000 [Cytobacillus sp. FSL R7-0696]|uniref:hypothetical protein n=1 Tax=Cytobacillus sp. FSL R7-0696 TaxID=2921691 RepID=UPI0030F9C819
MAKLENVKTIDMVNGEITKVEYNGDIYVKVDEGQGTENIGDIVIGKKGKGRDDSYFEIVEISSFNSSRSGKFYDEDDDLDGMLYYEVFRKQSTPSATANLDERVSVLESKVATLEGEPVAQPLKVGDYAKVVGSSNTFDEKGAIVKIVEDDGTDIPFKNEHLDGSYAGWQDVESLVRATDEEVAEAKAQAALEAKWAKIGRKPNEFKKGDIVHSGNGSPEFTVLAEHEISTGKVAFESRRVDLDIVGLVTPVESRFDRA